ncbi:MAG: aspartate aminotransferase family protein [Rhodospirillales bacterium]
MFPDPSSRSAALFQRAQKVMPGGNTRLQVHFPPHSLYVTRGEGCRVEDADGRRYTDFINNYMTLIHGHARPEVVAALTAQAQLGTCFAFPTESEIDLAEILCDRVESFDRIRFCNSGSEAVMFAIKAARAKTGRPMIAKCEGAYHGAYDPVEVSFETSPERWGNQPARVAYSHGTPAKVMEDVAVIPFNRAEESLSIMQGHAERLAAILVDPMPPRVGFVKAQHDYLKALRDFADRHGIVLIFDEVACFRCGYGGMQGEAGVLPDLTTLGKIIGGGMPIGAVAGRAEVMAVFDPSAGKPAAPHSGTFVANPMTMVAGATAMRLVTPEALERLAALGERFRTGVNAAFEAAGVPGQATGYGSLWKLHANTRDYSDFRSIYADEAERRQLSDLYLRLLNRGFMMGSTGLIALSTAMGEAEIDGFAEALQQSLEDARKGVPAAA